MLAQGQGGLEFSSLRASYAATYSHLAKMSDAMLVCVAIDWRHWRETYSQSGALCELCAGDCQFSCPAGHRAFSSGFKHQAAAAGGV